MKKLTIILVITLTFDILAFNYLEYIQNNRKCYIYKYSNVPLIYQKQEIKLNNIDELRFDDYFEILDFNEYRYGFSFDEDNQTIDIRINDNYNYSYNYYLIEPTIITKIEYITNTIYVNDDVTEEYIESNDYSIYYSRDYYEFALGSDISDIIKEIQDDIECYYNVTCDYSKLNPYVTGEYEVVFYNDYDKVIKIIKIT